MFGGVYLPELYLHIGTTTTTTMMMMMMMTMKMLILACSEKLETEANSVCRTKTLSGRTFSAV